MNVGETVYEARRAGWAARVYSIDSRIWQSWYQYDLRLVAM